MFEHIQERLEVDESFFKINNAAENLSSEPSSHEYNFHQNEI